MKEEELRKHARCDICKELIGHTGLPLFWTVEIQRHGIKMDAVNRLQGLTMMLGGNAVLASVMGPDEEMTEPVMEPVSITVCEKCALEKPFLLVDFMKEDVDDDSDDFPTKSAGMQTPIR